MRLQIPLSAQLPASPSASDQGPGPAERNALNQKLDSLSTLYRNGGEYRLGSGDLLEISVFGVDEFKHEVRVNSSGQIHLPLVGELTAENRTVAELENELRDRLHPDIIRNPNVSVFVKEYRSQPVFVLGAVKNPGQYQIRSQIHLVDLLAMAGGLNTDAAEHLTVQHKHPGSGFPGGQPAAQQPEVTRIDLGQLLAQGDLALNIPIRGGDVINVPKREVKLFYVIGQVGRPGAYALPEHEEKLLLTQALAWAGGPDRTAKLSKGILVRYEETSGARQEIPLDFKKVLSGKRPDIPVQAQDVIFIPGSTAKSIGYGLLGVIPNVATQAVIYGPIR